MPCTAYLIPHPSFPYRIFDMESGFPVRPIQNRCMKRLFTLLLITFGSLLTAQPVLSVAEGELPLLIMGRITSAQDSTPIDGVVVSCKSPARYSHSNSNGRYALLLERKSGLVIEFRHTSFDSRKITITGAILNANPGDTIRIDLVMVPQLIQLTEVPITAGPETVFGNWKFFVEDFMFVDNDRMVLLTFEKSLKESKVLLVDNDQKILSSFDVPGEAKELYLDFQGNINVMCVDSAFRVRIVPPSEIILLALPYQDFCNMIMPCIDTCGGQILFSNYIEQYPAFSYFAYNPVDTSIRKLRQVVDGPLLDSYNWEFDFLKPKDRLYARKMEMYTGIDKRVIAATMTGFPNSIFYTPLYAPMFVKNDTVCVFDHYSDTLFLYNKKMQLIGANKIDYHHPKNWKEWDRQLHQDEITGEIYARFEKGGMYTLKKIDIATGKIIGEYKIENPWVKHIRIRNGDVYYIYRPKESIQTKYLYREHLQLS